MEAVKAVVVEVLHSMDGDLTAGDVKIYQELEALARYIENAKKEIAALAPEEIKARHIPSATDELDAVVGATEEATNAIMAAAERIETVAGTLEAAASSELVEAVTQIYEACGFQDITGQRINKVVGTLHHIQAKLDGLITAFGGEIAMSGESEDATQAVTANGMTDEDLLNGPQAVDEAQSQDDIDALFASLD